MNTSHPEAPLAVKDLLQGRILSRLFAQRVCKGTQVMALKGGMAMRLAHGSLRHTKDIDLDADNQTPLGTVQGWVRRAVGEATSGGWLDNVRISEPKQTATTARWKISGMLPRSQAALHLTVEISFRRTIAASDVRLLAIPGDTNEVSIPVYTDEVLALNKIEALLAPSRDAPRDVVDLYILFQGKVVVDRVKLKERLGGLDEKEAIDEVWRKLESMDEARYQAEVLPVMEMAGGTVTHEDWTSMRLFVGQRLEELLGGTRKGAGVTHTIGRH